MGSDMTSHRLRGSARESSSAHRFRRALARVAPASSDVRLTLPAQAENIALVRHVLGAFAEAQPIEVLVRPDGDRIDVTVSDRGRGMGRSPDIDGPGLGLPLIAALAYSIELQEAPMRGNRLTMSFSCRPRLGLA